MPLQFYKYHGAGNDFVIIDSRKGGFVPDKEVVAFLCDRHKGIGADGLMMIEQDPDALFLMRYFNADGGESTMCGNGGRAIALCANHLGLGSERKIFKGIDGFHTVELLSTDAKGGGVLALSMVDVDRIEKRATHYFLNTGSPHYVEFVDDIRSVDVVKRGSTIRHSDLFRAIGGTNVNFVEIISQARIKIRTFERGVENETLACGTGATASAIATAFHTGSDSSCYSVQVEGGELTVSFHKIGDEKFRDIILTGPAQKVFEGAINL